MNIANYILSTSTLRILLSVILLVLSFSQLTMAQKGESPAQITVDIGGKKLTITEPGIWKLKELFKRADNVALVHVLSGDTEAYPKPYVVYKAEVIEGFKGVAAKEILYFGPYVRYEVGGEYLLFLIKEPIPLAPLKTSGFNYGTISYSIIFNEGYSAMHSDYQCVFDGKDTSKQCDYGIRVCTDYIILPKSIRAFPPEDQYVPFGCRWVRKKDFISLLKTFSKDN
jgi:hypothetical protein